MPLNAAEAGMQSMAASFHLNKGKPLRALCPRPQPLPARWGSAVRAFISGKEAGAFLCSIVDNHLRGQGSRQADPRQHQQERHQRCQEPHEGGNGRVSF
jgi:hypothetical protein